MFVSLSWNQCSISYLLDWNWFSEWETAVFFYLRMLVYDIYLAEQIGAPEWYRSGSSNCWSMTKYYRNLTGFNEAWRMVVKLLFWTVIFDWMDVWLVLLFILNDRRRFIYLMIECWLVLCIIGKIFLPGIIDWRVGTALIGAID